METCYGYAFPVSTGGTPGDYELISPWNASNCEAAIDSITAIAVGGLAIAMSAAELVTPSATFSYLGSGEFGAKALIWWFTAATPPIAGFPVFFPVPGGKLFVRVAGTGPILVNVRWRRAQSIDFEVLNDIPPQVPVELEYQYQQIMADQQRAAATNAETPIARAR